MMNVFVPPPAGPTINKTNLLEKLSFVSEGGPLTTCRMQLRTKLLNFHQFKGTSIISRQTIQYWFDDKKNSRPSRQAAFEFLLSYLGEDLKYDILSDDQKKVYAQLTSFLRNSLRSISKDQVSDKLYASGQSRIIYNIPGSIDGINKIADSLVGIYKTYRRRLSEGNRISVSQEVLRVFRRQRDVVFEHWYSRDGLQIDKFEGPVLVVGNLLWLMGAAQHPPERLRVMHFRNVPRTNYRWGIMSSDISLDLSHDPASCRILLCKFPNNVGNFTQFVKDHVRHISSGEKVIIHAEVIDRLIDNSVTALSNAMSVIPATFHDGSIIKDAALKVNQITLQEAIRILEERYADSPAGNDC